MRWHYSLTNDELTVTERVTGQREWQGHIEGYPVADVVPLPDSEDCLVLLDYYSGRGIKNFQNLLRYRHGKGIVWKAPLPPAPPDNMEDAYVSMGWYGGNLIASSWSGFAVTLDAATGRILGVEFTK